ncbi:YdeI family protein [Streptomyces sp. NPDC048201]|uniref:YdeI/OmpD-associated family protein n=1 Tax=Streptomyces sp. NPDC048201 TaxID=3365513 RepID=UPI003722124C
MAVFESAEAFRAWLDENHAASSGIWLKLRRKGPGIVALDYAQALDVALCYGWIDSQKAGFDDEWWLQRFTPRRARSKWSKVNRDKVTALFEQGRMRPQGQAEIDRAKAGPAGTRPTLRRAPGDHSTVSRKKTRYSSMRSEPTRVANRMVPATRALSVPQNSLRRPSGVSVRSSDGMSTCPSVMAAVALRTSPGWKW